MTSIHSKSKPYNSLVYIYRALYFVCLCPVYYCLSISCLLLLLLNSQLFFSVLHHYSIIFQIRGSIYFKSLVLAISLPLYLYSLFIESLTRPMIVFWAYPRFHSFVLSSFSFFQWNKSGWFIWRNQVIKIISLCRLLVHR